MKNVKRVGIVCLVLCMVMLLCSCGKSYKMEDYAGTYIGQSGTTIILNEDGTCKYMQTNWPTRTGTWQIEDNQITISGALDYTIYADIPESGTTLLFEADSSRWNDEVFVKLG